MTLIAGPLAAGPGGPAGASGWTGGAGRTGPALSWRLALPARGQEKGG